MARKNKDCGADSGGDAGSRLVKILAESGVASRRAAGRMILSGRVTVNGERTLSPGTLVAPSDAVELDGFPLPAPERKRYFMLNKPRGFVCTNSDRFAPCKALDLVRPRRPVRLFSAGRLDKDSEGLLLFSNDGDFVHALTHPRYGICKEYVVNTSRAMSAACLSRLRRGVVVDGEPLRAVSIEELSPGCYRFILNEGRKREIRRMTAAVGAPTRRLLRVRVGGLRLGDLRPGQWRELAPEEAMTAAIPEPEIGAISPDRS